VCFEFDALVSKTKAVLTVNKSGVNPIGR